MKKTTFLIAALAFLPVISAGNAEAAERYCREYTKSVRIGGDLQSAYGTACMQPDGSWALVSFGGHDDLFEDVLRASHRGNGRVILVERRPANYWYQPYRPVRHYYYRPYSRPVLSFYWGDNDRHDHDRRRYNRHDRRDRHDNDRDHHRKHGRNHHR